MSKILCFSQNFKSEALNLEYMLKYPSFTHCAGYN